MIKNYKIELFSPPCIPGSPLWCAKVEIDKNLTELLAYLNSYLKKCYFEPNAKTLIFTFEDKYKVAIRPREIIVGNVVKFPVLPLQQKFQKGIKRLKIVPYYVKLNI